MRIARVARPDGPAFCVVQEGYVALIDGHPFARFGLSSEVAPLEQVRLLAPILPSKVLCVGQNYADHAAEMGGEVPPEPLIFSKPSTAVIGPGDEIKLPIVSQEVHHEAELAVVIGRLTRRASPAEALDSVLGYTCGNDVTARDLQRRDGQWTRAKGFDSFCPLGPWIETEWSPADQHAVRCRVNGELRQDGHTGQLVYSVGELIAYVSAFASLLPGDILLTGTPAGVGPLHHGDTVEVEIDGIGTLANSVVAES